MADPCPCQLQSLLFALDRNGLRSDTGSVMDQLIADTIADARWFPWRFDGRRDELHFAWAPAEMQEEVTFLNELRPAADHLRILPRAAVAQAPIGEAPLHFILHSGLGGSTLLARALMQRGVVTTLKEPPILTDVIAFGLNAPAGQAIALRDQVMRLLARPYAPDEAVAIKMSSIGNGLVASAAAQRPNSKILCMGAPLEAVLTSLAKRGLEGRLGGRKLFVGLRNAGLGELGFSGKELLEQSDLQLAALGWLAIQRLIGDAAPRFGPERVRSISTEQFIERPREGLEAIARHLGVNLDVDQRIASGIFERHAKTGEPFDAETRAKAVATTMVLHGDEIGPVVEWARKVAEVNRIPLGLPHPLLA